MSDFEKALLFSEYLNTANFIFSNFIALVFAMLTASFFLAHKMGRVIAGLFLLLYTVGALMTGSGVIFAFTDFANLGAFIHQTGSGVDSDLSWLGPAGPGGANISSLPVFVMFMTGVSYVGSIAFFFIIRYRHIQSDVE